MMYTKDDIHEHDGKYHFTPNTVMYSVPKKSDVGKRMEKSKMGIVVHTKYHGNTLQDMKAAYEPDLHHFAKHEHVNLIPNDAELTVHTGANSSKYEFHMRQAEREYNKAHPETFAVVNSQKDKVIQYINRTVRDDVRPSVEGYAKYLLAGNTDSKMKQANAMKRVQYVLDNKKQFHSALSIHNHIQRAKDTLVDTLDQGSPFEQSIGGKSTGGEGYVMQHNGYPVKLVNRAVFSRGNFARHE